MRWYSVSACYITFANFLTPRRSSAQSKKTPGVVVLCESKFDHRFTHSLESLPCFLWERADLILSGYGQREGEGRTLPFLTLDPNLASLNLHQSLGK